MDEFCKLFVKSQDTQIDKLFKTLEDFKEKFKSQDLVLNNSLEVYNKTLNDIQNTQIEKKEELEQVFKTIDEYVATIERLERVVDKAESDLIALEEYCGI